MDIFSYLLGKKAAGGSSDTGKINFTTEEQEFGTWIDGNTVYMKVITGTTPTSANDVVSLGFIDENMDKIIELNGFIEYDNLSTTPNLIQKIPFLYMYNPSTNHPEYCTYYTENGEIMIKIMYNGFRGRPFYAVALYTKKVSDNN